jgi:hypothetical protein
MIRINLDADLANADWTKQTWDLGIDNVEDLRAWLQRTGSTVEAFKALPVYKLNVGKLPWLADL